MKQYMLQQLWEVEDNYTELKEAIELAWNTESFLPAKQRSITPSGSKLQLDKRGNVMTNSANLMTILTKHEKFKNRYSFNLLTDRFHFDGKEVQDLDYAKLRLEICQELELTFDRRDIADMVDTLAKTNSFHPIRDYLTSLRWDGTSRMAELTSMFKIEPTPLNIDVMTKFLIAAVARVMRPACKVDSIPVFQGPTGNRKSTALKTLMRDPSWFTDEPIDFGTKDAKLITQGKWFIELAELSSFNKKDNNVIKSDITLVQDEFRAPYDKKPKKYDRQFVYIGTTNDVEFLTDPTSNRRFWILPNTGLIDTDQIASIRDQIWAEAYQLYTTGEKWWMSKEQEQELAVIASQYEVRDAWYDDVLHFVSDKQFTTTTEVLNSINPGLKSNFDRSRVVKIMQFLKWSTKTSKVNGLCVSGWQRPKQDVIGKPLPQALTQTDWN